jgi:hypothetical protein
MHFALLQSGKHGTQLGCEVTQGRGNPLDPTVAAAHNRQAPNLDGATTKRGARGTP